jgi:Tetratricopeptide repeat
MAGRRRSYASASLRLWSRVSEAMDSKGIGAARSRVYIIVTSIAVLTDTVSATGLREYIAAEARKHTGERATIVGKVDCIGHGRRHTDVLIGGCDLQKTLLWVVVPDEVSGSELDCGKLRGVTIAVTGKIESSGGTPQITINSTSQIVPRTPLNPDYFSSAMEKQSQSDFDGAIADLDRAVELTHEASIYVQRAEVKQKKGDLDGAISDYDQLLEHYPNEGVYFLNRERLNMKKSDYAGVVADSSRAIELLARHYASHPNDHSTFILAQAYSERGEAKEAMGDSAGAITDYENSVRNDPNASIYKNKLKHAQAQASGSHEQSFNKSEVTPESIAEAFVQAHSGANVDAVAAL